MTSTWFSKFTGTDKEVQIPNPMPSVTRQKDAADQLAAAQAEIIALKAELATKEAIFTATRERFAATFYALPLPCFTVNEIGHVMEWNHAASNFFNKEPYEVADKPLSEILGNDVYHGTAQENIYQVFLGHQPDPVLVNLQIKNGTKRPVKWHISPVKDASGRVVGAVNTLAVLPAAISKQEPLPIKKVA